jgi:uncharacterized protein YbaP (TraB family)
MRLIITVILLFNFATLLPAQVKAPEKTAVAGSQANSLLWEISGNGLQQPSYLFGTMHILCVQDAQLSDSLQFSIDKAEKTFFEVDMDNPAELLGIFKYIRMNDNKKLSDLLTVAEYDRVKKYFSEHKSMLPLSMMERFKPYFIAAMLSESKMPCETKNGMEEVILREVKKEQKEVGGLETMAFQASVFDSIPYTEQAKELLKTIDSAGKDDVMTEKMLDVYRQQNLSEIEKITNQEETGLGSYLDLFLYGRNLKWIPVMDSAMKTGPTLFAVGAAHLPGERGVIELLKKAGYILRPMKHAVYQKTM